MSNRQTWKLVGILLIAAVTLVVVFQNWQQVEARLFFARLSMPLIMMLASMLVIGFLLGALTSSVMRKKH